MASSMDVSVTTNSFVITRLPVKEYHQYDVFNPDINIANKRQRAIHILQTSVAPQIFNPRAVYDGKRLLYASRELGLPGGGSGTFTIRLGNDPSAPVGSHGVVQVRITKTAGGIIRPTDLNKLIQNGEQVTALTATATNLLQLLIRQSSNQNNPTNNGRAFFSPIGKRILPGTGVELWRGFFQSVRPTIGKMLVTIDTSMAAVYESGPLIDVAMNVLNARTTREISFTSTNDPAFRKVQSHFKNRLVKTKTTGERTKTIHAIVPGPIGRYSFSKDGVTTTIEEHFRRAYNVRLAHPNTFGVRLSGSSAPFPVIVPAELCDVLPGQLYKKRLPVSATTAAVDFATMAPRNRLQTIAGGHSTGVASPIQGYMNSEFVRDAGMIIDSQPITLNAKLLAPPAMVFGGQELRPQHGAWNVMNQKFKNPQQMKYWGVVNFDAVRIGQTLVQRVIHELGQCCSNLGMIMSPPASVRHGDGHAPEKTLRETVKDITEIIMKECQASREKRPIDIIPIDMIIVLLPSKADEIRTRVKYWGDVETGTRTSCLREDKLQRANNQYFNNVAIKLNARLGGQYASPKSTILSKLGTGPFMIMGADVSHPGPGVARPSIASLVWSWVQAAASYIAFSEVQGPREEIIQDLQSMVKGAILAFGKKNKPPERIVFYRDGVSEGELETVKAAEIAAIKAACREVWLEKGVGQPLPRLTFIVVVKRHHVVFFPNDNQVDDGRTGNCRAGLVVDQLRSPLARDFYLQSHAAIKGTSRSGHYSILLDENFDGSTSAVQQLSFALCHVYAKATRSVSIPAPVYCTFHLLSFEFILRQLCTDADLVCARGKFHVDPRDNIDFDASTNTSGPEVFDLDTWRNNYKPLNRSLSYDKSMYFCDRLCTAVLLQLLRKVYFKASMATYYILRNGRQMWIQYDHHDRVGLLITV
ncbi:Piwi domain-containing protein [Mycena sp. CBHHK59/15]|nr:Piwi domain-containing protein [Mycena sp. CBHHK59/15]